MEGVYRVSCLRLGWGLEMATSGEGRQRGGAFHGQQVTWTRVGETGVAVATSMAGSQVDGEGEVSAGGRRVAVVLGGKEVVYQWMTEEELEEMMSVLEPALAPSSPYPARPPGRLVLLTGLPGAGKSSTGAHLAAHLAAHHRQVYYEGDCFWYGLNPFLPPSTGSTNEAIARQRFLHGPGLEGRTGLMAQCLGDGVDQEELEASVAALCADVARQRARLGGDWVVAIGLFTRRLRDLARTCLPHITIVLLEVPEEVQRGRLMEREGGLERRVEGMVGCREEWEGAGEDEASCTVTQGMTREEVAQAVLATVR